MLAVWRGYTPAVATLLLVLGGALPMWWLEWRRYRTKPFACGNNDIDYRCLVLIGVAGVILLFAGLIGLQLAVGGDKGAAVAVVSLPLLLVAAVMVLLAMFRPAWLGCGVHGLGVALQCRLRGQPIGPKGRLILRSWLIRAFFLPLMMGWAYLWVSGAMAALELELHWFAVFSTAMALLYAVDTSFAVIGYLVASERMGSHVRSTDVSWLGWLSALCCYPPLSVVVLGQWLVYKDGLEWQQWLSPSSWQGWCWGGAILLLTGIYTWATVVFGPRFSNLTHRGIVTAGPYRWLRHPAYLCKNLSWWLISVPFVSAVSVRVAVLHCLALVGVNCIYWMRAVTEERHLRRDPEYVAYAQWVDDHGLWARIRKLAQWLS